ncbi:MAG: hypothetical protein HY898_28040 [Deltaproteobacteria bacterium]|nr:hypothetical protein [Deltaproteobacteria bacterium]
MTEPSSPTTSSAAQPDAGSSCSTCGSAMAPDASRCENCGTTRGQQHKCPFCRVVAEPEPDPVVRWRCPACGGPRIPYASPPAAAGEAIVELRKVRSARSSQIAWRTAGIVSGAFGVLAVLIMLGVASIVHPPLVSLIAGLVLSGFPLFFAGLGLKKAAGRTSEISRGLEEAWLLAARDLVRRKGIMPTKELAASMRIDHEQAEKIMARLGALDELRSDITDSGDLAVSVHGARMRVAAPPEPQKLPAAPVRIAEPAAAVTELAEPQPDAQSADRGGKAGA